MGFTVYSVANKKGVRKAPAWARTALIDDDGNVFVTPLIANMTEMEAILCLSYDGTSGATMYEHIYVPAEWLKNEKPKYADAIDMAIKLIKDAHQQPMTQ